MTDGPAVLVAGGPVERRLNHALAAIVGLMIGGGLGIGGTAVVALKAVHEVKSSRIRSVEISCREADEHHRTAQVGLEALALRTSPPNPTPAEIKARKITLDAFVNALAPYYDCAQRVKTLTKS
jgi:hypothetical protein